MYAPLLLATALVARVAHLPAQPVVVVREAHRNVEEDSVSVFAYCDVRGQSTIMMTNAGPTAVVVDWTLTAFKPGFPPDFWSSVSRVEPGHFEGWMSPAPYLHLDFRYDDDGLPTTNSIDAFCSAATGLESGLEDQTVR